MVESEEELKSLLMKVKESEKIGLKLNIQKTNVMASSPITVNRWEINGNRLFSWAPKSLQMMTAAMKLKDTCSLGEVQFSSVTQSCPTLCNPMDGSMPGFCVRHQLLELAQTHVHQVSDAIQPSHPLPSPSPPAYSFIPASGSFPMNVFFISDRQSIGV